MEEREAYVFEEDCALVARPVFVTKCRDQAERVDFEEGLLFFVGVDFDVLVIDVLELEGEPDALDEGTVKSRG